MDELNQEYFRKLFGFSQETENLGMNFKDKTLEQSYRDFDIKNQLKKSKIFCISIVLSFLFVIATTIFKNGKPTRNSYIILGVICFELISTRIAHNYSTNFQLFKSIKYIRFFLFYLTCLFLFFFQVNSSEPITNLKFAYGFILLLNFFYQFMIEFNYIMLVGIPVLNTIFLLTMKHYDLFADINVYPDIAAIFIYYFSTFLMKKEDFSNKKLIFFETFKNKNYIEYTQNLINSLNTMIISLNRNEVFFINNFTKLFLEKNYFYKFTNPFEDDIENETKGNIISKDKKTNQNLNECINSFFKSLVLTTPNGESTLSVGTNFSDIVTEVFANNSDNSNNFSKIGYFTCFGVENSQYFDVFIRKLKFKEEIVEVLIYDITEIKQAEKTNIESKYKQKILSKIAHEFKTPLITIITLINRLIENKSDEDLSNKPNLLHVNNLSNFVLLLISDMIQYVSNCFDVRLNLTPINLREALDFCFNILSTLVECNETKKNTVKTILEIDDNVEKIIINTDEHRLKQIILNLITNAYKFTHSGYIKLRAKLKKNSNILQIYVKDTGIGIKEEDKNLILKENIQINLDQDYNSQGSGLGLSIIKNLANHMNLNVGFKSNYGFGSKFFVNFLESFESNIKTINLNERISLLEQQFNRSNMIEKPKKNTKTFSLKEEEITTRRAEHNMIKYIVSDKSLNTSFISKIVKYQIDNVLNFSLGVLNSLNDIIVVVDDHKLVRENTINLIRNLMKNNKLPTFDIIEGSDGIDLLRLVINDKEGKIKYIFCDENMEYLNGSDAVKIIRSLETNRKIRKYHIVSITAYDDNETKQRIINSGYDLVINKPCTNSVITEILSKSNK